MDKKFLNKVIDQIVRETEIDYDEKEVSVPFPSPSPPFFSPHLIPLPIYFPLLSSFSPLPSFTKHCRDVYGLNLEETEYVWNEYRRIIKDKIENNGI